MQPAKGVYSRVNIQGQARWYVRIMVDGTYQRFAPHGGFASQKEANRFAQHAHADITRGKFFPDKFKRDFLLPLQTLLEEQSRHMTTRPNTKNDRHYQAWWVHYYGTIDIGLITPRLIDQAEQRLIAEGKSPQTQHHYLKFLRHRLALAQRDGQLEQSPFQRRKLPTVHNMRHRFYSEEERRQLYKAMLPQWREAAEIAGLTGLRWAEQFRLTRGQIHLAEQFIALPTTKAGQPQARILNHRAIELLKRQLARHRSDWLYPSTEKGDYPIDYSNFRKNVWAPACVAAGITNAKWNDWRHTFASDLTMAGHSDRTVATLLGHTTTNMVKRYAHLADAHLRQAVESVANGCPTDKRTTRQKARN